MPAPAKSSKAAPVKIAAASPAARPVKKGDHVFLVDGSGYIFRAYHAIRFEPRTPDGTHVNAVYGFCNMLWKLLKEMKPNERPTHLAVIFDKSEKTFRTEMYKDYKAHRPPPPDDLIPQFPLIREAVRAFEIPCLEQAGYEADDLIATYARIACEAGATATIVSSDKDLMQLVNDCVVMYDTMKDARIGIPEDVETLGGLIMATLGSVPRRGQIIPHPSGVTFEIMEAGPRRLHKVRIFKQRALAAPDTPLLLPAPSDGSEPGSAIKRDSAALRDARAA